MVSVFIENGRRSIEIIHRLLLVWLLISLFQIFNKSHGELLFENTFLKIVLPQNISVLLLLGVAWLLPLLLNSFVKNLKKIAWHIKQEKDVDVLLTYPSLLTSSRAVRIWFGIFLSYMQASLSVSALLISKVVSIQNTYGDMMLIGVLLWFFAAPMLMFSWQLANWDAQVTGRQIFRDEPISNEKP